MKRLGQPWVHACLAGAALAGWVPGDPALGQTRDRFVDEARTGYDAPLSLPVQP